MKSLRSPISQRREQKPSGRLPRSHRGAWISGHRADGWRQHAGRVQLPGEPQESHGRARGTLGVVPSGPTASFPQEHRKGEVQPGPRGTLCQRKRCLAGDPTREWQLLTLPGSKGLSQRPWGLQSATWQSGLQEGNWKERGSPRTPELRPHRTLVWVSAPRSSSLPTKQAVSDPAQWLKAATWQKWHRPANLHTVFSSRRRMLILTNKITASP